MAAVANEIIVDLFSRGYHDEAIILYSKTHNLLIRCSIYVMTWEEVVKKK